ncbi:MAG: hypothetical protein IE931_05625 [Sphingobacteriales bacterium]|nr:hypothetical protein [Sphingobacteriales bacterium]
MILAEQFLISKTKEIDNPIINWGVGYTAEVMMEFAKLYHQQELKKLPIHDVIGQSELLQPPCPECDAKGCIKCAGSGYVLDEPLQ